MTECVPEQIADLQNKYTLLLAQMTSLEEAFAMIPAGPPGDPGDPGLPGIPGPSGSNVAIYREQILPHVVERLRLSLLGTTTLKAIAFGDSVALFPWYSMMPILAAALRLDATAEDPANAGFVASNVGNSMGLGYIISGGVVTPLSNQFNRWFTGNIDSCPSGAILTYNMGGGAITTNKIVIPFLYKTNGGILQLKINGANQGAAVPTTGGTAGTVGFISYTGTLAGATVTLEISGNSVELPTESAFHEVTNRRWLGLLSMGRGGLNFEMYCGFANTVENLRLLIAQTGAHLITMEAKEPEAGLAGYYNQLMDVFDSAIPSADKLMVGSTPVINDSPGDLAQRNNNTVLEAKVSERGFAGKPYFYVDKYRPFVRGYDPASAALFVQTLGAAFYGDGIHYNPQGIDVSNVPLRELLQRALSGYGYANQPTYNKIQPSYFAFGTSLGSMTVTDVSGGFGLDLAITVPRTLTLKNENGDVFFTGSTFGGINSRLSATAKLGSTDHYQYRIANTFGGAGPNALVLEDDQCPDLSMAIASSIHIPRTGISKAILVAGVNYPANSMTGTLIWCPDTAVGKAWVTPRQTPGGSGDWVIQATAHLGAGATAI